MTDEPQPQHKETPAPVKLALVALDQLAQKEPALAEEAKKKLPGFALRLAAAGQEVTVEGLIASTRAGEIDRVHIQTQRQKTYEEIMLAKDAENLLARAKYEASVIQMRNKDENYNDAVNAVNAAQKGDLETVKTLVVKFSRFTGNLDHQFMSDLRLIHIAATGGYLDIIKFLVEERGVSIHSGGTFVGENIATAAAYGHIDVLKYFATRPDADIHFENDFVLRTAVRNGQLETVKYLVETQGVDIYAGKDEQDGDSFMIAASVGDVEMMKYLLSNYSATMTNQETAQHIHKMVHRAASYGHLEMLKVLLLPIDEAGKNMPLSHALGIAVANNRMNVVRYFVEERGMDFHVQQEMALQTALAYGCYDAVDYLVKAGADVSALPPEHQKALKSIFASYAKWRNATGQDPVGWMVTNDPRFYKPQLMATVEKILAAELKDVKDCDDMIKGMAFHTAGLFGTEARVLQYLEKWGKAGKAPLHNIVAQLVLPPTRTRGMDVKAWGDAVLKCGPSMAMLVTFGDKMAAPEKTDDGRTWSMVKTREKAASFAYENADQNPALAKLCFEYIVPEQIFERALMVAKLAAKRKSIPDIALTGEQFDMPGAKFYRLAPDDIRGLFLGEMTDCCQSIGREGDAYAINGFTSESSGFYVVEDAKGRVIGQTWAWRGKQGELVFDSLETLGKRVNPQQWFMLTKAFAKAVAAKPGDVTAINLGTGGETPPILTNMFALAAQPAEPRNYTGHRDSKYQLNIWNRPANDTAKSVPVSIKVNTANGRGNLP